MTAPLVRIAGSPPFGHGPSVAIRTRARGRPIHLRDSGGGGGRGDGLCEGFTLDAPPQAAPVATIGGTARLPEAGAGTGDRARAPAVADDPGPRVLPSHAAEEALPAFETEGALLGDLRIAGSDTLNNVPIALAEGFATLHPKVNILVEAHGSATGPPALAAGAAELAAMVCETTPRESTSFTEKSGYPIARPAWLYVNRRPGEPLSPTVRAFLLYTLSREGRVVVDRSGFTAPSRATAEAERAKVL